MIECPSDGRCPTQTDTSSSNVVKPESMATWNTAIATGGACHNRVYFGTNLMGQTLFIMRHPVGIEFTECRDALNGHYYTEEGHRCWGVTSAGVYSFTPGYSPPLSYSKGSILSRLKGVV